MPDFWMDSWISGYGVMIAQKLATLLASLNVNGLVGNISATRNAS
jgi:hypothetical protein